MTQSSLLLVVSALICVICAVNYSVECKIPFTLANGHEKVNKFLNGLKEEQGNLNVSQYLEAVEEKSKSVNSKLYSFDANYKLALEQVVALGKIIEAPECNVNEGDLLRTVAKYAGGHMYVSEGSISSLSPYELIVNSASVRRAEECKNVWLKKFNAAYPVPASDWVEHSEYQKYAMKRKEGITIVDYARWLNHFFENSYENQHKFAALHLMYHSVEDPERCKFTVMFDKYLTKPCKSYINTFGQPILFEARFDSVMFEDGIGVPDQAEEESELERYYESLYHSRACSNLIDHFVDFKTRTKVEWAKTNAKLDTGCFNVSQK